MCKNSESRDLLKSNNPFLTDPSFTIELIILLAMSWIWLTDSNFALDRPTIHVHLLFSCLSSTSILESPVFCSWPGQTQTYNDDKFAAKLFSVHLCRRYYFFLKKNNHWICITPFLIIWIEKKRKKKLYGREGSWI